VYFGVPVWLSRPFSKNIRNEDAEGSFLLQLVCPLRCQLRVLFSHLDALVPQIEAQIIVVFDFRWFL